MTRPAPAGGYRLAVMLAALAGAVDAIGFVHWRGLFVSFMSGNSTTLVVETSRAAWGEAMLSASVIGSFVAGVILGELIAAAAGRSASATVLLIEAILLAGAGSAGLYGFGEHPMAPVLALAMGTQNASIHKAGGISVALSYVTGTLVHVGRCLAQACLGRGSWSAALPYLGLWCGLAAGAAAGALAARSSEAAAILGAAAVALALAWASRSMIVSETSAAR